jgi:3-methyladenine DNA glycosylase AlkD
LAVLIADPNLMTDKQAEDWAKDFDNYGITDMFVRLLGRSPLGRKKAEKWSRSKEEWIGSAGWGLVGHLALSDQSLPDEYFDPYLETIEREIHKRKNRVRYEMNGALIAIGVRNSKLEKRAIDCRCEEDRQGRSRPWRDELQDARCGELYRQDQDAPAKEEGESG